MLNDYVGNFRAHVGYTYYMQPLPINNASLFDTHNGIFDYDYFAIICGLKGNEWILEKM